MGRVKKLFKEKKALMIGVCSLFAVIALIFSSYLYIRHTYNKYILDEKPKVENDIKEVSPETSEQEVNYEVESDIVNVLLVGVDTRGEFDDSRTDSIIMASIDPSSKKMKLTSLMRDMYVMIPGKGYNKINAAFELGGIELLKETINYNFGLNVDNYIAIDFKGFQYLIDTLDGVELEVKNYEVKEINKFIKEVNGNNSIIIQAPGIQKLNGQQALAYCRIRMVGNNDYERTERQRRVVSLLLAKIKDTSVLSYPKLYSTMSTYVKTNIPFEAMLKIVYTVYKFGETSTEDLRIPVDGYFKDASIDGQSVLIPDLKYNATKFYKFIYNTVPTNLKIPNNSELYKKEREIKKTENTNQDSNEMSISESTQNQTPVQVPTQPNNQTSTSGDNMQQNATPVVPPLNTDTTNITVP